MLGSDVCTLLGREHTVYGYDIDDFDILDAEEAVRAIARISPSVVVHTAAFADVEACETERRRAFEANVVGAGNVAEASARAGSLMIYISTDYVFDGTKRRPYEEGDEPNPLNYYGLTKLEGEERVRRRAPRHLVVRTSWLFGPNGRNFVDTILQKAEAGEDLRVVDDQRGCPTYTMDLAAGLKSLIEAGLVGLVHMANSGDATWFELARHVVETAGLGVSVRAVESAAYPTRARRPVYSVLTSKVLGKAGIRPLPDWKHGVEEHLKRRGTIKGGTP
jgi:dTDP-4-dehydrorhamnose reductase